MSIVCLPDFPRSNFQAFNSSPHSAGLLDDYENHCIFSVPRGGRPQSMGLSLRDDPGNRTFVMPWVILVIAALFEIAWAIGLKYSDGFSRLWPSIATILALIISVGLLGIASKPLPVGTAYAVWTGIGAVGTVVCGIAFFGDPATPARLVFLGFIVAGILGLKFT